MEAKWLLAVVLVVPLLLAVGFTFWLYVLKPRPPEGCQASQSDLETPNLPFPTDGHNSETWWNGLEW